MTSVNNSRRRLTTASVQETAHAYSSHSSACVLHMDLHEANIEYDGNLRRIFLMFSMQHDALTRKEINCFNSGLRFRSLHPILNRIWGKRVTLRKLQFASRRAILTVACVGVDAAADAELQNEHLALRRTRRPCHLSFRSLIHLLE